MKLDINLTRICRSVATVSIGIALGFGSAMAMGQDAAGKPVPCCGDEPQQDEEKKKDAVSTTVCPLYPFMYHGTYVSWYAVVHPGCTEYVPYDGPDQMSADCAMEERCVTIARLDRDQGRGRHRTHPCTERDGIDPPNEERIVEDIADEIETGVKYVEFPKSGTGGGGGQMVRAKVWFFEVTPTDTAKPPMYAGIGYEVEDGEADRTHADGEVVVVDRSGGRDKRASVLVLTDRDEQIWRPYNILMHK